VTLSRIGEDLEKLDPPALLVGTWNGAVTMENSMSVPQKPNLLHPALLLLGINPKEPQAGTQRAVLLAHSRIVHSGERGRPKCPPTTD
jgi:hypothetical protein